MHALSILLDTPQIEQALLAGLDDPYELILRHSVRAACYAGRVLFLKDGQVFHQLYRANMTEDEMYGKIADTRTLLQKGGRNE